MFGIAESWAELEKYEIRGYQSYNKSRCKITKFGRNPGGLAVYVRNITESNVEEITMEIKEIMWIGLKNRTAVSRCVWVFILSSDKFQTV